MQKQQPGIMDQIMQLFGQSLPGRESINIIDLRKLADNIAYAKQMHDESAYSKPDDTNQRVADGQTLGLGPMLYAMDQMMKAK